MRKRPPRGWVGVGTRVERDVVAFDRYPAATLNFFLQLPLPWGLRTLLRVLTGSWMYACPCNARKQRLSRTPVVDRDKVFGDLVVAADQDLLPCASVLYYEFILISLYIYLSHKWVKKKKKTLDLYNASGSNKASLSMPIFYYKSWWVTCTSGDMHFWWHAHLEHRRDHIIHQIYIYILKVSKEDWLSTFYSLPIHLSFSRELTFNRNRTVPL